MEFIEIFFTFTIALVIAVWIGIHTYRWFNKLVDPVMNYYSKKWEKYWKEKETKDGGNI